MKKFINLLFLVLTFSMTAKAQQYSYSTGSTVVDWANVNGYPFSSGLNKVQWLYQSSMFATAPAGNVTKLYFRSASSGSRTFQDLTIRMAPTSLTAFPASLAFETQGFVTVFQAASHTVTVQEGQWFEITLQTPFPFSNGQNFIVEISKTGSSGQVLAAYMPESYKGHVGATTANALIGNTSMNKVGHLGMDITQATNVTLSGPDTICLNASGTYLGSPAGGTWTSSNPATISINAGGVATGLSQGTATLTYNSGSGTATKNVYVKPTFNPSITLTASPDDTICAGSAITLNATVINGGASPYYAWKVNNNPTVLPNNNPSLTYTPGTMGQSQVKVIVTSSLACAGTDSVEIPIYVISGQSPAVSIASNAAGAICAGTNVTFTATPVNGGTAPVYQWKKNGANVGTNSNTYADATLLASDVISCTMQSNLASPCANNTAVVSNLLSVSIQAPVTPALSLDMSTTQLCKGGSVMATVVTSNGGSAPTFRWYINNNLVPGTASTYTFAPANGDDIYCVMTSNANCVTNPVAHSDTLSLIVTDTPQVTITLSNGTLSSSAPTGNQWYQDGNIIAGATAQTYTPAANGNYQVVVTANGCSGTSNTIAVEGLSINALQVSLDDLKLYPNPATHSVNVVNKSHLRMKAIHINNVLGQQLKSFEVNNNQYVIKVADLPEGIYQVIISFEEGTVVRTISVIK